VPRREPYWARLAAGLYLGYRKPGQGDETWIARRRNDGGKQEYHALGTVEDFDKAARQVREWASAAEQGVVRGSPTVADACEHYVKHLRLANGANSAADAEGRFRRLVSVGTTKRHSTYGAKMLTA
jgi:hypothetical protein